MDEEIALGNSDTDIEGAVCKCRVRVLLPWEKAGKDPTSVPHDSLASGSVVAGGSLVRGRGSALGGRAVGTDVSGRSLDAKRRPGGYTKEVESFETLREYENNASTSRNFCQIFFCFKTARCELLNFSHYCTTDSRAKNNKEYTYHSPTLVSVFSLLDDLE